MSEPKKEWYVVNTYAGHENRVKENLERRIETMGLQDFLFQIVVAEEKEIEYKNGKEVEKTKNLFSGYLFVQMIMTDEAWYIVRNTPGVTGFIGSSGGGAAKGARRAAVMNAARGRPFLDAARGQQKKGCSPLFGRTPLKSPSRTWFIYQGMSTEWPAPLMEL